MIKELRLVFLNILFCIGVWLINNVMIVSGEQWRDSAIHIHVSFLPQTPFPSRLPELRLFLYLKIFESVQVPYAFYWINSWIICNKACSVQLNHSVVSDSLQPHQSQHARPPCLSPTPGVYSNSCPLSQWCHPTMSSSVIPFSSCPQSLPASGSFPMSQLFTWGGQSTGVSTSASVLPMNT